MRSHRSKGHLYRTLQVFDALANGSLIGLLVIIRTDPSTLRSWGTVGLILVGIQGKALELVPFVLLISYTTRLLRRRQGEPRTWRLIHFLLNKLQEGAFRDELENGDPPHEHRATLFRYQRFALLWRKWPWSGWLKPVERSGHVTRRSKSRFRAPDDPKEAEGIAGKAWSENRLVKIDGLPDIYGSEENASLATDEQINTYARLAGVRQEWVRERMAKRRFLARSFCAIPVEVGGILWGVVVLDSRNAETKTGTEIEGTYRLFGELLGKALERS